MKIEYKEIEYIDNDGVIQKQELDKVFTLALINECHGALSDYCGINVGISISHKDMKEANKFQASLFGNTTFKKEGYVRVDLIGVNKERIPVMVAEGNKWIKPMGTACLFGYLSFDWLAGDEHPKMKI